MSDVPRLVIRSAKVSPGTKPLPNRLSSQPATKTTSAPVFRSPSASPAHSASMVWLSAGDSSHGKGANHTSSPSAAASRPATSSRAGSPPEIRTAVQCRSRAMTRISRSTWAGSKTGRLRWPAGVNPVS